MMKLLVLVIAISVAAAASVQCCSYDELEKCFTFETIYSQKQIPKDMADVDQLCGLLKAGEDCIKAFNDRCVTNQTAQKITEKIDNGLANFYRNVCYYDGTKKAFLEKSSKCYGKRSVLNRLSDLHKRYVALVEKVATYEKNSQLSTYCCAIKYFDDTTFDLIEDKCDEAPDYYLQSTIFRTLGSPIDLCANDLSSDYAQCRDHNLNSAQKAEFDKITNLDNPVTTKHVNGMATFYQIFN